MNKDNKLLFDQHADILSFRDLAESTQKTYLSYMESYICWTEDNLSATSLSNVSWEEVRTYFKYLKEVRELNPRTINVHIAQLRDFYQYVLHKDWDRYQVPTLKFDEKLPNVPTIKQVNVIIDTTVNIKHKAMLAILYSSGIRVSELCRLHCKDIYVSKKCIYISRSKNRSDRFAILSDKAYAILVDYIRFAYRHAAKEDWLFPGRKEGSHISTATVSNVLKAQLKLNSMEQSGFTLHSLRHAFGLHLYESGCDLISLKEAMGHKSLSSTTIYLTLGVGNGRSVTSPYDL